MGSAGVDLAVVAPSQVVIDRSDGTETEWKVPSGIGGVGRLVARLAREGVGTVVVESTAMAWFVMAVAVARSGADMALVRVSGSKTAALRRFFSLYTQTDRTDAQALKLMTQVDPKLRPLVLPSPFELGWRRLVTLRHKRVQELSRERNRLWALGQWALRGISTPLGKKVTAGLIAVLERWPYIPALARARPGTIAAVAKCSTEKAERVKEATLEVVAFYDGYIDWDALEIELRSHLDTIRRLQADIGRLDEEISRRHNAAYPNDPLLTVPGVGKVVASIIRAVVANLERFTNLAGFRGFTGLCPRRKESGVKTDKGGRPVTKAGPATLRWALFLAADNARHHDPALADLYWRLRLAGKHHNHAVVAVATHLTGRIWAVIRQNRPYQYQDLEGNPISREQARRLVAQLKPHPNEVTAANQKGGPPSPPQKRRDTRGAALPQRP